MGIAIALLILAGILKLAADWSATTNFRKKSREQFKNTLDACNNTQKRIDEERAKANAWKEQYKK